MPKTYEPVPARTVAFLGLGVMGYPMAGHLAGAGHRVTVYNRTAAKSAEWVAKHGGASAPTGSAMASFLTSPMTKKTKPSAKAGACER